MDQCYIVRISMIHHTGRILIEPSIPDLQLDKGEENIFQVANRLCHTYSFQFGSYCGDNNETLILHRTKT